ALACVDYGTALAPMRLAHYNGKKIFVFVDETRPRGQGARLTAWEMVQEGIDHALIADNAAGHYMKNGEVDIVMTGADRIAKNGDAANKIGTYEKAVLAKENNIPFYVAAPISTFDLSCLSGEQIPIEERGVDEVHITSGIDSKGEIRSVRTSAPGCMAKNPAFDVTPAKYIRGFITEFGLIKPEDVKKLRI
ncbi:MAG: S-methyl-5-thioribose-1-phosphate isomerase, partial [Candidatus Altiarchaeota archaeon]|nr:S-methyl-5-thioribose-1-phosphate isomerase [Candidatus Altiarchaeota archaeon]